MNDHWNPEQYERFRDEREAPFEDLFALVRPAKGMRIVDLGCGTGRLTAALHQRLGAASTLGVDSSAAMLAKAGALAEGGLAFLRADIEHFAPAQAFDLAFSNAALHWLDDQRHVLARITGWLAPGGQLAVQVPANFDHASHRLAAEVALEAPFADALEGWTRGSPVLAPEDYATCLYELGFAEQRVQLVVYPHVLASGAELCEWVRGTLLTAYESRLPGALFAAFLERYRARILAEVGAEGPLFYPFKRILLWGRRAAETA